MVNTLARTVPFAVALAIFAGLLAYGAGIFTWTVMAAALAGAVAVLAAPAAPPDRAETCCRRAAGALLVFGLLTLVPLPLPLSRVTGMQRYRQNAAVAAVVEQAGEAAAFTVPRLTFAATRNRAGTLRIVLLGVLAAVGAGMGRRFSSGQQRVFIGVLAVAGCVTAGMGFVGRWIVPQGDRLWYWIPVAHGLPGPVAGFINPNHYAGFLALLLPAAIAGLAGALPAHRFRCLHVGGWLLCVVILAVGIATSLSRGGLLAATAGVVVTTGLLLRDRRRFGLVTLCLLPLLVGVVALAAYRLPPVGQRLASLRSPLRTDSVVERMDAWQGALRIWRRYPLAGCGANAFRVTYPQARHTTERDYRTFAENEYVQWLAETGLVGLLLLLALIVALVRHARTGAGVGEGDDSRCTNARLAGVLAVAAVHAGVDFVLRLPLYTFTLATLIAMHPRWTWRHDATTTWRSAGPALACLCTALLVLPWTRAAQQRDALGFVGYADAEQLATALAWAPVSAHLWVRLGERFEQSGDPDLQALAGPVAWRGAMYDPNNYRLWLRVGHLLLRTGDRDGAAGAFAEVRRLRDWVPVPALD